MDAELKPGMRVEVQDMNGNWYPAVLRSIEPADDGPRLYWIEFTPARGMFLVQESDIRKQAPAPESVPGENA